MVVWLLQPGLLPAAEIDGLMRVGTGVPAGPAERTSFAYRPRLRQPARITGIDSPRTLPEQ